MEPAKNATMVVAAQSAQLSRRLKSLSATRVEVSLNVAAYEKEATECRELGRQYRMVMRKCYDNDEGRDELTAFGNEFLLAQRMVVRRTFCSPDDDDLTVLEQLYINQSEDDEELGEMNSAWIRRFRSLLAKGYDHGLPSDRHNIHVPSTVSISAWS